MNSEQGTLESLAEAGERLCGPDIGRELVPPLRCKNRSHDFVVQLLAALRDQGTRCQVEIFERSS